MTVINVLLLVLLLVSVGVIVLLLNENRRLHRELAGLQDRSDSRMYESGFWLSGEVNRLTPGVYYCDDE